MDETQSEPIKILAIGPLSPVIGGTAVSFQILIDALAGRADVDLRVMDLPSVHGNWKRAPWQLARHTAGLLRQVPESDIVALHCNPRGIHIRVGTTSAIARLAGKPLVVRTFGGVPLSAERDRKQPNRIIRALRKADLYLGQTRQQVQEAREAGVARVEWFPTHRPMPKVENGRIEDDRVCRRFVFLSHVKPSKGIHELIEAGERFGSDALIDVYGPMSEGVTEAVFEGARRVHYRGVVEPDHVLEVLRQYDALLLPTYFSGEGYPGIIIEAFAVGLPVICTRWNRLEELVDESSGLLVEPRSADALYQAMQRMMNEPGLFLRLRRGAFERRNEFDLEVWSERFVRYCNEVVAQHDSIRGEQR